MNKSVPLLRKTIELYIELSATYKIVNTDATEIKIDL